ncbi:MAG: hypothetical protein ABEH43_01925 [Flavobacteriales bacterium]
MKFNLYKTFKACIFLCFILSLSFFNSEILYSQSRQGAIINQLNRVPVYKQGAIYDKILNDSGLLKNKGLAINILKIGREKWLEQFFFARRFAKSKSSVEDWVIDKTIRVTDPILKYQQILSLIPNRTQNYHALEMKIVFSSYSRSWNELILRQIKVDPMSVIILIKPNSKIHYPERKIDRNALISGGFNVNRALYESYRFNKKYINKNKKMKNLIVNWAKKVLKTAETSLALQDTAIAILLDEGWSKREIKEIYKFDEDILGSNSSWTEKELLANNLKKAQEFRKQYPKWPMDHSKANPLPKDFQFEKYLEFQSDKKEKKSGSGNESDQRPNSVDTPGKGP